MKKVFNRQNLFIILMIISTIALAGTAGYYSVFGLSSLFAGASIAVIIMASTLEFSKLIIASYLHNHWNTAGWLKWYLTLAVAVLMLITSVGIYGFLTSAYQSTADKLGVMDKKTNVVELKKNRYQEQLNYYISEKDGLTKSIDALRNGLANNVVQYKDKQTGQIITSTSSSNRKSIELQLNTAIETRDKLNDKIESLTDSITTLDIKVVDLQTNNQLAAEVGPLRYMSELTGSPMATIVNWFTLLIVFVFDPLAISMVIALNKLINKNENDDSYQSSQTETDLTDTDTTINIDVKDFEKIETKEEFNSALDKLEQKYKDEKPNVWFEPEEKNTDYNDVLNKRIEPAPKPPKHTYIRTEQTTRKK